MLKKQEGPKVITPDEMQLADTVRRVQSFGPFDACIVTRVDEQGRTHLLRVYATTADFAYTGGVIPYIGFEEIILIPGDKTEWHLFHRKELK
jgi:hypothetical protein